MILVCYLVPPGDEWLPLIDRFFESYQQHPAGVEHEFLLILKGAANPPCRNWPTLTIAEHLNDGLDIGSLLRVAAEHPDYDQLMWLGSHCRILADDWLAKLHAAASLPGVGAVSATASFEAGVSGERPNPHLRTSTLMITPALLNSLGFGPVRDRRECYEFEHGQGSLYRRLRARGLDGLVVGRSGHVYREEAWGESHTFRHGDQHELLIADKHTDNFAAAPPDERVALARAAGWEPE